MRWMALLVATALLGAMPVQAAQDDCNEPCGYIVPIIDLDFPTKQLCGGGRAIYEDETPEDCEPLMADGEQFQISGTVRITWDAQEEPTYPLGMDLGSATVADIEVSFSETQSNPSWLAMSFDPPTYTIGMADLYSPDNYEYDLEGNPILTFLWERPVNVTVERTGDPDAGWQKRIDDRNGVLNTFMKAKSSASGQYYREAFGVEEFRFNAYGAPDAAPQSEDADAGSENAPGFALLGLLVALGAAMVLRRQS